jgi:hypothetical protein
MTQTRRLGAILPAVGESPLRKRARAKLGRSGMAEIHVRRDKAALFQRVQTPPGDRSSRKQPGQAWRRRNV